MGATRRRGDGHMSLRLAFVVLVLCLHAGVSHAAGRRGGGAIAASGTVSTGTTMRAGNSESMEELAELDLAYSLGEGRGAKDSLVSELQNKVGSLKHALAQAKAKPGAAHNTLGEDSEDGDSEEGVKARRTKAGHTRRGGKKAKKSRSKTKGQKKLFNGLTSRGAELERKPFGGKFRAKSVDNCRFRPGTQNMRDKKECASIEGCTWSAEGKKGARGHCALTCVAWCEAQKTHWGGSRKELSRPRFLLSRQCRSPSAVANQRTSGYISSSILAPGGPDKRVKRRVPR